MSKLIIKRKRKRPFPLEWARSVTKRPRSVAQLRPSVARLFKGPFAQSVTCVHRYCSYVALDPTAGAVALHNFRLTSLFDPDETGAGQQPLGRDQMAALYRRYMVISAEIQFQAYVTNSNALPMIMHLCDSADVVASNGIGADVLCEKPNVTMIVSNSVRQSMKRSYNARKWQGKAFDAGNVTALVGASPSTNVIAQVGHGPLDGSSNLNAASFFVTIIYKVLWTEPAVVAQS